MLTIETHKEDNHDLLVIQGEIDASNSVILDQKMQELTESGSKSILVDGSGLEYISSAGLGVFMSYLEDFQEEGITLKIFALSPRVFEVFKILGLDQLIDIYESKEAALEA
ncbi:STAS domain-containing protein [Algoriphagus halophilus]|uniref:Anti-sigma factor antagonist n=1 Tax=Algoriphagus halophilus TaxID=226505 RepID=A0A1N6HR38_9BACT|nr:STAS domain-containing protein [Algoriphagus halophilus]SIO22274.1 anti-sigma B factor antagonist [Algoriphagus halophilus]